MINIDIKSLKKMKVRKPLLGWLGNLKNPKWAMKGNALKKSIVEAEGHFSCGLILFCLHHFMPKITKLHCLSD